MAVESALFGQPPVTEFDLWVVTGIFKLYFPTKEPDIAAIKNGTVSLPKPPGYTFESRRDEVLIGAYFIIPFLLLLTSARLATRLFVRRLTFGKDDILIIPATVSELRRRLRYRPHS